MEAQTEKQVIECRWHGKWDKQVFEQCPNCALEEMQNDPVIQAMKKSKRRDITEFMSGGQI